MDWIYLNVSVQNNSKVVTVHNQSTAGVRAGDGLLIPGFGLVQVSGVFSGQLELKLPWTNASQQSAQAAIVPTFGDFEGAAKTMRDFTQTTQANFAEMEKWFTQTGTVKFKGQNNIEHTVRTAKQMDADVKAIEQSGNEKLAVLEQRAEHVYDEVSEAMMTEFNRRKALRESIKQKATLSLDFVNNEHKIYGPLGLETKPLTDILVTERATAGTYQSPFGLRVAEPNEPCIEYDIQSGLPLGLLSQVSSTNFFPNSKLTSKNGIFEDNLSGVLEPADSSGEHNKYTVEGDGRARVVMGANAPSGNYTASALILEPLNFSPATLFWAHGIGSSDGGYNPSLGFPQLVSWSFSAPDGIASTGVRFGMGTITNVAGRISFSRPQIEPLGRASGFVPTAGSAVTRSTDFNFLPDFVLNPEFSLIVYVQIFDAVQSDNQSSYILSISDGTSSEFLGLVRRNTGEIRVSQTGGASFISAGILPSGKYKMAVTCGGNVTRFYISGKLIGTSDFTLSTSVISNFSIFGLARLAAFQGSGFMRELLVIPRCLNKSEAEELTK